MDLVGPNAVLQTLSAVERLVAPEARRALIHQACLPNEGAADDQLVDAAVVRRLNASLFASLGDACARTVLREAGRRTGAYVLEHRIPALARTLLSRLPRTLAAHLLLGAIARHAWTFAGDAPVTIRRGVLTATVVITRNPLATAPCDWHQQVFLHLFEALLDGPIRVEETACVGLGADACRFVMDWTGAERRHARCA